MVESAFGVRFPQKLGPTLPSLSSWTAGHQDPPEDMTSKVMRGHEAWIVTAPEVRNPCHCHTTP